MKTKPKPKKTSTKIKRGFTLVEILIVVIILGILAAIVIPQFTNASTEARNSSLASTLQAIRSQFQLYKTSSSGDIGPTFATDMFSTAGAFVPTYFEAAPDNPFTPGTAGTLVTSAAAAGYGWLYTSDASGNLYVSALDTSGNLETY